MWKWSVSLSASWFCGITAQLKPFPTNPLCRPPAHYGADGNISSSSASLQDVFRQRYSVTWHPRLPLLILSDGYMATLLRAPSLPSPTALISGLLLDTAQGLERARILLLQVCALDIPIQILKLMFTHRYTPIYICSWLLTHRHTRTHTLVHMGAVRTDDLVHYTQMEDARYTLIAVAHTCSTAWFGVVVSVSLCLFVCLSVCVCTFVW